MPTISPLWKQLLEMPSKQYDLDISFRLDIFWGYRNTNINSITCNLLPFLIRWNSINMNILSSRWNVTFDIHHMLTKMARVYRCQLDIMTDTYRWIILIYIQKLFYSIYSLLKNELTNLTIFLTPSVFMGAIYR